jgi:hypothetical protein
MSIARRVRLRKFEDSLATEIATRFTFEKISAGTQPIPVKEGTTIFVNHMPEQKGIQDSDPTFDPATQPQIAIITVASEGVRASSGSGSKQDWTLRFIVRLGTVPENAKERLEELHEFILAKIPGVVGKFIAKNAVSQQRPTVFQVAGDDAAYANSVIQFLVVTLPL